MFNLRDFARILYKSLFKSKGTNYRLTAKRAVVVLLSLIGYCLLELIAWTGLLLDELLYRDYRNVEVRGPIFIIGNPRSGTTFLQRLLAKDSETFISMRLWEMVGAPSVTMRKLVWAVSALDARLGSPLARLLGMLEESWQEDNVVHTIALRAPEEDEYLMIHIFSTLKIWLYAAMVEETERYTYFDSRMPEEDKERMMSFYRRCIQRHLHAHGVGEGPSSGHRRYLAKNPHYSPMVDTLLDSFPHAKFIYLARNPLDVIPSYVSLKEDEWQLLGSPVEAHGSLPYVLDMAEHWYNYPLERLDQLPRDSALVISFNDLVADAGNTVTEIYHRFGIELSPAFEKVLHRATQRAREYESEHEYSLSEMGLTHDEIVTRYRTVFERFDFDTRAPSSVARRRGAA